MLFQDVTMFCISRRVCVSFLPMRRLCAYSSVCPSSYPCVVCVHTPLCVLRVTHASFVCILLCVSFELPISRLYACSSVYPLAVQLPSVC